MSFALLSAADSNIGKIRSSNQDSGYAGYQLFFVADGMGGHAGGDIASAITAQRMAQLDAEYASVDDAGAAILASMLETNQLLTNTVANHSELSGMGTTFSSVVFVENRAVVSHIGDSRVYLTRDGQTVQVTKDHTFVQRLVDLGKITEDEALVHPRRNVLLRVIGDTNEPPQLDFQVLETKPGDRWMMCSDGLNGYVSDAIIGRNLQSEQTPEEVIEVLIGEALEAGAPDNVTCVVVDVVPTALRSAIERTPKFVGSASNDVIIQESKGKSIVGLLNSRVMDALSADSLDREFISESSDEFLRIQNETKRSIRFRKIRQLAMVFAILGLITLAGWGAYSYTQTRFYVSESNGYVAIYKGIREELVGIKFSSVYEQTTLMTATLPDYQKQLIDNGIYATNLEDAYRILQRLKASVAIEQ